MAVFKNQLKHAQIVLYDVHQVVEYEQHGFPLVFGFEQGVDVFGQSLYKNHSFFSSQRFEVELKGRSVKIKYFVNVLDAIFQFEQAFSLVYEVGYEGALAALGHSIEAAIGGKYELIRRTFFQT